MGGQITRLASNSRCERSRCAAIRSPASGSWKSIADGCWAAVRLNWQPISDETSEGIRTEFALPSLEQVRGSLTEVMNDPEPVMQQLVRVLIGDGTFCPGFQFIDRGQLHPTITGLFRHGPADPAQLLHSLDGHTGPGPERGAAGGFYESSAAAASRLRGRRGPTAWRPAGHLGLAGLTNIATLGGVTAGLSLPGAAILSLTGRAVHDLVQ